MSTGTVKWFNDSKGFGFITPDDGSEDLFAHFSGFSTAGYKTLHQGESVAFEVVNGLNGREVRLKAKKPPESKEVTVVLNADLQAEPLLADASIFLKAVSADLEAERQLTAKRLDKQRDEFLCLLTQITSSDAKEAM